MDVKHLDEILLEIEDRGFFSNSKDTPEYLNKALKRLEREDLIYEKSNYLYDLTSLGQEVVDLGGYANWKEQLNEGLELENLIKDLTIKQLKGNIFQLRYWWVILIVSSLFGFISGNFQLICNWINGE